MDKRGVALMFRETFGAQNIRYWKKHDRDELRRTWSDFIYIMLRNKTITPKQADTWGCPFLGERKRDERPSQLCIAERI